MNHIRQELFSSAFRHARRARRTTGRMAVSALGFGVAYYLDTQNGAARRDQLRRSLRRGAATIDTALMPEVEDAPPDFTPLFQGLEPDYEARLGQLAQRAESN
jgi:hypothetical protein